MKIKGQFRCFQKAVAKHVKRVTLLVVGLSHDVNRPFYWQRAKLASEIVVCLLQNTHVTLGQYGSKQMADLFS